jgi:REP element-mobilizing transposase RayT
MARKLRVQYPGAIYHLMNRGDRREAIFEDDQDRERFLETLGEACDKTGWQVHA